VTESTISITSRFGAAASEPVPTFMALAFSDSGCNGDGYPRVVRFTHTGDSPPGGWGDKPTIGLVEAADCVAEGGYYGIRVLGDGLVDLEHNGAVGSVHGAEPWCRISIRVNGVSVGFEEFNPPPQMFYYTYVYAADVAVVAGDVVDVYVEQTGHAIFYYRSVGTPWRPSLYLTGDLTAWHGRRFLRGHVTFAAEM